MSAELLDLAKRFASGEVAADDFADAFIERWKSEKDSGACKQDDDAISECLSSIFCVADLYEPSQSRKEYEFSEVQLRQRVKSLINASSS